jgi:hypothetical protein
MSLPTFALSVATYEKANAIIDKLKDKNLLHSNKCDILTDEKPALMKKCIEAFDGTIIANHGREMALEALINTIQKCNVTKSRSWQTRASWAMQCGFRLRPTMSRTAPPSDNQCGGRSGAATRATQSCSFDYARGERVRKASLSQPLIFCNYFFS